MAARTTASEQVEQLSQEVGQSYADLYAETIDSVVQLRVYVDSTYGSGTAGGTGFVYDDGHVVTNDHVVQNAREVYVRFRETGWQSASVVGSDVYSDLAVLSVEDRPEAAAPLSLLETDPAVGTEVMAIGNPFQYSGSASVGIVSGINRTLPSPTNFSIPDAIQTDAAVNPGNSGGPLVTLEGDVAGVVNSGGGDNIGFAISAPLTRRVVPALIEDGEYEHSYMGVRLGNVGPLVAEANDLEAATGVYISVVSEGGPSDGVLQGRDERREINGVEVPVGGDVIVRMGETPIPTRQALSSFLSLRTSPGDSIEVEVVRDGQRQVVELTLGTRPEPER
jgi:S1-C subfamily serine protease